MRKIPAKEHHMKYIAVDFICQLESPAVFSPYKGSMLRGALGTSLRRSVCMTHKRECGGCMLQATCMFPRLFGACAAPAGGGTTPLLPPPFCIEPPHDRKTAYDEGERFSFGLKLFSHATEYLPYFVHAFMLAGRHGLGKRAEPGQGRFRLVDIRQGGNSLYDAATETLHSPQVEELPLPSLQPTGETALLACDLLTPLRFKADNRLAARLDFPTLMRLIIRRIKSLCALDGLSFQLPQEEFSRLFALAADIVIEEDSLRWEDWSRYSGRQQTVMQLGGLVGRIVYRGAVAAFAEYLAFASLAHIGKQSSFGLGALDLHGMPA